MNMLNSIWILWFLSEIYFIFKHRAKKANSEGKDKNSFRLIWVAIYISVALSIFIATKINVPIVTTNLLKYIGLALIVAGVIIRFTAIRSLGRFFTVKLAIDNEHRLINTGLYKTIRHPAYTGSMLSFLGLGLYFNNWLSLFVIVIPVYSAFIYRINVEEKLLLQQKELNYSEYMKHTKKLIPFIY